jgi:hypothetical protein
MLLLHVLVKPFGARMLSMVMHGGEGMAAAGRRAHQWDAGAQDGKDAVENALANRADTHTHTHTHTHIHTYTCILETQYPYHILLDFSSLIGSIQSYSIGVKKRSHSRKRRRHMPR